MHALNKLRCTTSLVCQEDVVLPTVLMGASKAAGPLTYVRSHGGAGICLSYKRNQKQTQNNKPNRPNEKIAANSTRRKISIAQSWRATYQIGE